MLPTRNLHFLSAALVFSLLQFFFFRLSLSNPDETAALLEFKSNSDPRNSLSSWAAGSDPCSGPWIGVTCDPKTHRVTKLVLENLNLTGSTRPLARLAHLGVLSLNRNDLRSSIDLSSWPHLNHLYLAHNRLAGPLPAGISRLRHLRRLDLSHNRFSGEIPLAELTQLPRLLTLRLESNSFSGTLTSAAKFHSGSISDFNVSDNNLWGEIPASLSKFGAASFSGNDLLCGDPLPLKCPDPTPGNVTARSGKASRRTDTALAISIVGGVVVLLVMGTTATWCLRTRRRRRRGGSGGAHKKSGNGFGHTGKHYGPGELKMSSSTGLKWAHDGPRESEGMVVLDGCPRAVGQVGDLLQASAVMLGKGSVGTTFKVAVGGGDAVAVKRIKEKRNGGKETDLFLRQIGELRHPNIVSLRAYHNSSSELLLVYDFMANGSLNSALHGNRGPGRRPLSWDARLKLAAGSAEGLAFLHGSSSKAKLFHGNLNSSNILVDEAGNARIADVGLHHLITSPISSCPAYQAPELRMSGNKSPRKYNQKCDVYSFGVVLLEILTGRMAAEEGDAGLVEWAKKAAAVKGECRTWEVMDFEMVGDKEMEKEMWALLEVGLLCVAQSGKDRPTMGMVHRMVEGIRQKGIGGDGAKSILDELTSDFSSSSRSESTS